MKYPGQKVGCHWSSVAGNIPHWLQDTIIVRLQGRTRGRGKEKLLLLKVNHFTFHLFDAAQSVFQGVQCGRLVIVPLLRGQVTLELFQGFNDLLLRLGFGRLLTATVAQPQTRTAASQILHNHYLRQKLGTHRTYIVVNLRGSWMSSHFASSIFTAYTGHNQIKDQISYHSPRAVW